MFLIMVSGINWRLRLGLKAVIAGILYGAAIFIIYGYFLPYILASSGLPVENGNVTRRMLVFLPFLIAVESVASATRGTVYAFVFRLLSKLMGILLFINAVGRGVLSGTYNIGGVTYEVSIDIGPIVAGVVLLSLPFMVLDVMGFVRRNDTDS